MSSQEPSHLVPSIVTTSSRRSQAIQRHRRQLGRPLRVERLEDRRLLAVFTVTNLDDLPVAAVDDAPGTLRQAIYDANNSAGADEIVFDGVVGTLALEEGELVVTEALSINGPGMDDLTIDAQLNSRIFNITATTGDFTIAGLTLAHGRTTGSNPAPFDNTYSGGAVRSLTSGLLTIAQSRVAENSTTGFSTQGGGIYAKDGKVAIGQSIISGNEGGIQGGGVFSRDGELSITYSIVENNAAAWYGGGVWIEGRKLTVSGSMINGNEAEVGAGISAVIQELNISDSEISGNTALGGGGMMVYYGNITIDRSTFSGNQAGTGGAFQSIGSSITITDSLFSNNTANLYYGGGLRAFGSGLTIEGSTFSDNSAKYGGGAIWFNYHDQSISPVLVSHSTVTGNETTHSSSTYPGGGGGIHIRDDVLLDIDHSIVAGNIDHNGVSADIYDDTSSLGGVLARYSLIGDNTGSGLAEAPLGAPDADGNLIGDPNGAGVIDPLLGPLADNGGWTLTHALLPGSPAIGAGDPDAEAGVDDVPLFDQRGWPFNRVSGGRIDIGAFEVQVTLPELLGDYNRDGMVDAADYAVWRDAMGDEVDFYEGADGSGDGIIDEEDYVVWRANFGNTLPPAEEGGGAVATLEQSPSVTASGRQAETTMVSSAATNPPTQVQLDSNEGTVVVATIDSPRVAPSLSKHAPHHRRDRMHARHQEKLMAVLLSTLDHGGKDRDASEAPWESLASEAEEPCGAFAEAVDSVFEKLGASRVV